MCFILDFYVTHILTSTTFIFECVSRLIKVTDNNDAKWKIETSISIYIDTNTRQCCTETPELRHPVPGIKISETPYKVQK
jgi:hypothetical protein